MDSLLKEYVEKNGEIKSKVLAVGMKKSGRKNRTINADKAIKYLQSQGIDPADVFELAVTVGSMRSKLGKKSDMVFLELEENGCVDDFRIEWFTMKAAP